MAKQHRMENAVSLVLVSFAFSISPAPSRFPTTMPMDAPRDMNTMLNSMEMVLEMLIPATTARPRVE